MSGYELFEPVVIVAAERVHIAEGARIDSFVKIEGGHGVHIGRHVHISSFCHVNIGGGEVYIGDFAGMSSGSKVLGGSNKPEGVSMSAAAPAGMQVVERSRTTVGHHAFLGVNSIVLAGVTIGEGAVIGAGALVNRDVPPYEIWAGVPARRAGLRPRAPEVYESQAG